MTFSFTLDWNELDTDLRERKITEYIQANLPQYRQDYAREVLIESMDEPSADELEAAEAKVKDADVLESQMLRDEAEDCIQARFPIHF